MVLRRLFTVCLLAAASPALAAESKALVQLTFAPEPNKPNIDVWVTRAGDDEGGLIIKLIARGVGPKAQALTIYSGGGGDEGPGESDLKSIGAKVFELPGGRKAVRVDFTYQVPESKTREIQTDTWIVGFGGKTHKLLPEALRTRFSSDRSKVCREREETTLSAESDAEGVLLVAARAERVDAVYGDDHLPVDKTCRAAPGVDKKAYRLAVDEGKPASPSPDGGAPAVAPAPAPANAATDATAKDLAATKDAPKDPAAKAPAAKDAPAKDAPAKNTPAREAPKAPPANNDNDD